MKKVSKPLTISVIVSNEVRTAVEQFAEDQDTTMSRVCRQALVGYLAAHGAYHPKLKQKEA
jgi:hypothetical protein